MENTHTPTGKAKVNLNDSLRSTEQIINNSGLQLTASKIPWTHSDLSGLHVTSTSELLEKASLIYYNFRDRKHYSYLPLGQLAVRKLENLIKNNMTDANIQELYITPIQPIELWKQSGRIDKFGKNLMYIKGNSRLGEQYIMSPTNEEVVTLMAKSLVSSYKQLPMTFYQFCDKFRDDNGAKHGIVRSNVFRVLEAYSLNKDQKVLRIVLNCLKTRFYRYLNN